MYSALDPALTASPPSMHSIRSGALLVFTGVLPLKYPAMESIENNYGPHLMYSGTSEQGTLWGNSFVPCREVVPISEVK